MVDGTLIFDTKIDSKNISKDKKQVEGLLKGLVNNCKKFGNAITNAYEKPSSKVVDLNGKISQTQSEITRLQMELAEISASTIKTDMFSKMEKDAQKAENKLLDLLNEREALEGNIRSNMPEGVSMNDEDMQSVFASNKEWQKLTAQIDKADIKLSAYEAKMKSVSAEEKFADPTATAAYTKKEQKINSLNSKLDTYKAKLSEVKAKENAAASGVSNYGKASASAGKKISGMTKIIKMSINALAMMALFKAVQMITEALTEGSNNLAKYSSDYNKQLSSLMSANTQLKNSIATMFAPLVTAVMPILTSIIQKFSQVATAIAKFNAALFGNKKQVTVAKTVTQDYAKSLDKTKKSSDKFLASFDTLNVVSKKDEESDDSVGGVSPSQMFETVDIDKQTSDVADRVKKAFEPLKTIQFDNLTISLGRLKDSLVPLGESVFSGLEWGIENVITPLAGIVIEDILPAFFDMLASAVDVLTALLDAAKPAFEWLWTEFLLPIAKWTGGKIVDVLQWIAEKLTNLSNWITEHKELVQNFVLLVAGFAAAWLLVNGAIGIWNLLGVIATAVTTGFGAAVAFLTSPIGLVVLAIGALIAIILILVKYWDQITEAASYCFDRIKEMAKGLANCIIGGFENFINWIIKGLNKIKIDVPDWITDKIGLGDFGFNIQSVKLPRLATGMVIPPGNEFAAILGDQTRGRNIETPENLLRQIIREENAAKGTSEPGPIHIFIGDEEVFDFFVRKNNGIVNQTGRSPILV